MGALGGGEAEAGGGGGGGEVRAAASMRMCSLPLPTCEAEITVPTYRWETEAHALLQVAWPQAAFEELENSNFQEKARKGKPNATINLVKNSCWFSLSCPLPLQSIGPSSKSSRKN